MTAQHISPQQLRTLHTLFGLYSRRSIDLSASDLRAQRLSWAASHIGHEIASFRELRIDEAAQLIDLLKQALGQEVKRVRRPRSREAAMAAGTHGRRNRVVKIEILATREDVDEVDQLRTRVGMTREGFEAWLKSKSSPLRQRGGELRTISDCNRVRWALKSMLRRAG